MWRSLALVLLFTTAVRAQPPISPGDDVRIPPDAGPRPRAAPSGDIRIDALLWGTYQWPPTLQTVTYSFYSDATFRGNYYGNEQGVSEVSEAVKRNVRAILAGFSTVFKLKFVEVTETPANIGLIRVMRSPAPSYAYAYVPSSTSMWSVAGDVHLGPAYDPSADTNSFQLGPGSHGYLALAHELGHTMGLKHPHAPPPTMPPEWDSCVFSLMSYNFSPHPEPSTLQPFDKLALIYLYGPSAGGLSAPQPPTNLRISP